MTPRIALLVIGDGRDRLRHATLDSFAANAQGAPTLACAHQIDDREHELGFCGAIREGWRRLREVSGDDFDYVFHLEEDWRFDRPFRLDHMARALEIRRDHSRLVGSPDIAQIALRRNAVAPDEKRVGGLVELWPDEYAETMHIDDDGTRMTYLEHRLFFTTNPSLYRRDLLDRDWPSGPACEEAFGQALVADGYHFAFWGSRRSGAWITHTGTTRTGTGY